jgi:hypothetical protein
MLQDEAKKKTPKERNISYESPRPTPRHGQEKRKVFVIIIDIVQCCQLPRIVRPVKPNLA